MKAFFIDDRVLFVVVVCFVEIKQVRKREKKRTRE